MPITEARRRIGDYLWAKIDVIQRELYARVGVFDLDKDVNPEYAYGLKESISIGVEYGIRCIESGERTLPPIPVQLYAQARLAARSGIDIKAVLGRYLAGYRLLDVFAEEAAEAEGLLGSKALREIRRVSSLVIDRVVSEIVDQHADELGKQATSPETARIKLIRKQLAGEPIDTTQLNYDFEGFHIGVVANGRGAANALKGLAKALDCIQLTVEPTDTSVWAWLGKRTAPDIDRIEKLVSKHWPAADAIAIGEVGKGLGGWRLTHHQAVSGLLVSMRQGGFFRYGDNPMQATLLSNPLLEESFRQMYLAPLRNRSDGAKLFETLSAYFVAKRNAASAASTLGVKRQTVSYRLKQVEETLGRSLIDCGSEIDATLRHTHLEPRRPQAI